MITEHFPIGVLLSSVLVLVAPSPFCLSSDISLSIPTLLYLSTDIFCPHRDPEVYNPTSQAGFMGVQSVLVGM